MGTLKYYAGADYDGGCSLDLSEEKRFRFKEFTETEIQGRIINLSLGFRGMNPENLNLWITCFILTRKVE